MKRQQDRDSPPGRGKRSRSSYPGPDHALMRDRMSPDFDRRDNRGKFGGRDTKQFREYDHEIDHFRKQLRDDRIMDPGYGQLPPRGDKAPDYRSLCISGIPSKVPDPVLKETLTIEFQKFGEMNVKVAFSGDQRVAYVNFRYPEDARAARHTKSKFHLFERQVRVEPVFNKRRSNSPNNDYGRDFYPPRGGSPPHPVANRRMGRQPPNIPRDFPPKEFNPPQPLPPPEPRRAPNEKFPHHLDHVDPEFDDKATRTLFVGNLDVNITEGELRRIFEKYGTVEDVDIKRPQRGQGNAYAFIKFMNLDCAHRCKVEMSGRYIGKFQCKIGYGKVTPTTCLWVGGLGPWVTHETLEREFDRFGVIHRIEWPHGKSYAYVLYDSIDAAQAACQEMRGFPMGGRERRLRVDFADVTHITSLMPENRFVSEERNFGMAERTSPWKGQNIDNQGDRPRGRRDDWMSPEQDPLNAYRNPDNPRDSELRRGRDDWDTYCEQSDRRRRTRSPEFNMGQQYHNRTRTPEQTHEYVHNKEVGREDGSRRRSSNETYNRETNDRANRSDQRPAENDKDFHIGEHVGNLNDLAKLLPVAWNGALILKSSAFAARMHVVSGDVTLVDNLMRDPTTTETPVLRITQRLRLDQPKLEDVGRRIAQSGPHGHCILLAMPSTLQNYDDSSSGIQQRPLKNLVTYLKQKEAAGVISLPPNPTQDKNNIGVLHAFPPCQFGYNFLMKRAPKLPSDSTKEDHLVVVVICGAA